MVGVDYTLCANPVRVCVIEKGGIDIKGFDVEVVVNLFYIGSE